MDNQTTGWQPIETAPQDRTWVLLWWPYWHHAPVTGYFRDKWGAGYGWYCDRMASEDGVGPTHWMPLPEAPR